MSKIFTKLFGFESAVTSPPRIRNGSETPQAHTVDNPDQEIMMVKETMKETPFSDPGGIADQAGNTGAVMDAAVMNTTSGEQYLDIDPGLQKTSISELQAIAREFNAAFNVALYELESTRKQLDERTLRIDDLNESIRAINDALSAEIGKGRSRDEEYSREKEQLNERIAAADSERERLQQLVHEQIAGLDERTEEISKLSFRIEELTNTLGQRTEEARHAQEEYARERDVLTGKLNELQEQYDGAESRLKSQQTTLEARDRELAGLGSRIDGLTAELESRRKEVSWLNEHVDELTDKIEVQSESMRIQSESHARACEELNGNIISISDELESLREAHKELEVHAEKLENLNRALHESSSSENALHKKVLEGKSCEIESLKKKLEAAYETLKGQPGNTAAIDNLQNTLYDLESRLKDTEAQKQVLADKARMAEELESEIAQLRTSLQIAGHAVIQSPADAHVLQSLEGQIAEYRSAMEVSRAEREVLEQKLRDQDELEQEVLTLRETLKQVNDRLLVQPDSSGTVDALRNEAEQLRAALAASRQNCLQLEAAISSAADSVSTRDAVQSRTTGGSCPAKELINRGQFVSHINNLLNERKSFDVNHTVMYILIDNFIRIRDEIGILNSEQVINDIYGIIESYCDNEDIISRFGDCTFAILSSNESMDDAHEKANRICSRIENEIFESAGQSLVTTASIGICSIREGDTTADEVVSRADIACDAARTSGGNRVMVGSAIADKMILNGNTGNYAEIVSRTLAENRIKIHYQPISSIKDLPGESFEVLIRIVDESGSIILPGEFFAMADKSGHSVDIDYYVIENSMKLMSEKLNKGITLFIKLTRQSVADHELPVWIMEKIKEYSINPAHLVFEIAESVVQSDLKNLSMLSKALHAIGCKVAIEHYRMSTQLQHLQHICIDYLKIDSGLIDGLSKKDKSLPKVTAIMELANKNKYLTIAEGVENPSCLAILWELGVSYVQGYFIQVPTENPNYDFGGKLSEDDEAESTKAVYTLG